MAVILHLLPSLTLFGGTPAKVKLLIERSCHTHLIYCTKPYEVTIDYLRDREKFEESGIIVYEGFHGFNLFKHYFAIRKVILLNDVTIINCYFKFEALIACIQKMFQGGIKVVKSFVGNIPPQSDFEQFLLSRIFTKIDFAVYISKFVKVSQESRFPILNSKTGRIVYNSFIPKPISANILDGFPESDLLCISGLNSHKNLPVLLHAIHVLREQFREILTLRIIGDGPLREQLTNMILALELQNQVFLDGFRSNTEDYLCRCKIYVHSADNEGLGISVLEAMQKGRPVILANAGALPEIIEDGVSGILVDPYDPTAWAIAISSLNIDSGRRLLLGNNGKVRAACFFSVEKFVTQHDEIYTII